MNIWVTRDTLLGLIRGKKRLRIENNKFAKLYGIIDNKLTLLTLTQIKTDGSLKIIEKPIRAEWFKYERYLLKTKRIKQLFL